MQKILIPITTALMMAHSTSLLAQQKPDKNICKYSAEHMIKVAEQSLSEKTTRSERKAKRKKLAEQWRLRLDKGEDPCLVYADIQKAATTF